jgi:hypothetical protein
MVVKFTPFDFVKNINSKGDKLPIADYTPFVINRALSHGKDTILFANIMNMYPTLSNIMQYDFYYYGISQRKRFNKWIKKDALPDIGSIQKYYNCSPQVAIDYSKLLSAEQIKELSARMSVGGKKK